MSTTNAVSAKTVELPSFFIRVTNGGCLHLKSARAVLSFEPGASPTDSLFSRKLCEKIKASLRGSRDLGTDFDVARYIAALIKEEVPGICTLEVGVACSGQGPWTTASG